MCGLLWVGRCVARQGGTSQENLRGKKTRLVVEHYKGNPLYTTKLFFLSQVVYRNGEGGDGCLSLRVLQNWDLLRCISISLPWD